MDNLVKFIKLNAEVLSVAVHSAIRAHRVEEKVYEGLLSSDVQREEISGQ
jgi:hypothetical protein